MSQIMLLPSLYFAAINNTAISKKESFSRTKTYFNEIEWLPIIAASDIRQNWNYKMNFVQKTALTISHSKFRRIARRYFAPKIDPKIQHIIDSKEFSNSLQMLLRKIKSDI
jgi:hypothetical protein